MQDLKEVATRLRDLDLLLPDLVQRLPRLKADLLMKLLSNTEVSLVTAVLPHTLEATLSGAL